MNYYTSDLHFGYEKVIQTAHRPFSSCKEMNDTLVRNINERTDRNDVLIILGDEGYGKGIDDLYINGHSDDVIYTNRNCLYSVQKELDLSVREALNIADCPQNKIPKDTKARYQVIMQGLMESALLSTKCL